MSDVTGSVLSPAVSARNLTVTYGRGKNAVTAVDSISFDVERGQVLGLVGESGSGKSTVANALMGIIPSQADHLSVLDLSPTQATNTLQAAYWSQVQMIFQDPISSLNPRRTVAESVELPLKRHDVGEEGDRRARVNELLELVGLDPLVHGDKRPAQLSGGQCQRVAIARAMALTPDVLLCDEAVSALDVSVQAQILNLLANLRDQFELTMIFISHDLAVVRAVSDRVLVMYHGAVCEEAPVDDIFERPAHPYTRLLLDSIPGEAGRATPLPVERAEIGGCVFRHRCPEAIEQCQDAPALEPLAHSDEHIVACHLR